MEEEHWNLFILHDQLSLMLRSPHVNMSNVSRHWHFDKLRMKQIYLVTIAVTVINRLD